MCGIVGIATGYNNGLSYQEADVFKTMLFLDQLRGFDSTGVFSVSNKGNVGILKEASHASDFLKTSEFASWKSDITSNGLFVVGHNRAATRGTIKDENAHPFWVDDKIILVQNGTYKGDHKHLKDTEVDTHAVAHVIAEESDIEKALQKINAAYALVWYDVSTKTLNLIRNDERPLWIAYTKNDTMLFASEFEFILFAASRCNLELKSKPYLLPEHHLYQLTLDGKNSWSSEGSKKIDAKYRFHQGTYNSSYKQGDDYTAWWQGNVADWDEHVARAQRTVYGPTNNTRNQSLDLTVHDYVHSNKLDEFVYNENEIQTLVEECEQYKRNNVWVNVEFFDYFPGNSFGENCKIWIIVGRQLSAQDGQPSMLYYYNLYNVEEKEAFRQASIDNISRCKLLTHVKHQRPIGQIATVLVADRIEIKTLTENVQ